MWFKRIPVTPEVRKERRKQLLFGAVSGLMLGLSFPPLPLPYLMFAAFIPYFFVLEKRKSLAEINRFTYFTFFIFNAVTLYWVGSWQPDTDPFLMISGVMLFFWNPCVMLIPSTLYYITRKKINSNYAIFLFPVFWVFYEYIYTVTDFRFPWLTLGNGLPYFQSYIQIADIIGVYGLSLLILYINILLFRVIKNYLAIKKFNKIEFAAALLLVITPVIYGNIKINSYKESGSKIKVGIIQPNIDPWNKWDDGNLAQKLDAYLSQSKEAIDKGAEVLVWPETALPVYFLTGSYKPLVDKLQKFIDTNNVNLITGMPHATFYYDKEKAPEDAKPTQQSDVLYTSYNSVLLFSPKGEVQIYKKMMLVPFGEKVPLVEYIPILGDIIKWNVGISSWNTGKEIKNLKLKLDNEIDAAAIICIESIYPDFIADFVDKGAEFISVVTNDSWYGDSSGPYQHKEIAVLRAVENRRTVIRAANGGISCIINPIGETLSYTQMYTKDLIVGDVELRKEKTFYTKFPRLIPNLVLIITLSLILFAVLDPLMKKLRGNADASD
ncbi:MAG: apolipoprotein N-acyltransferase [Melioribacteraceae bacterium]|nr:apolipoprotein N-acyltransferase [Melioribacteraceae bacterium]MCF8356384.1 apolipoprotein N-acyltransferase [Melioribacteraceae bacterium]MCF8395767.1 apolipoprotein N-acyltransferase [Melioribacteraceae bacterium]MCF8420890.1 apolipoprotein N-acyltransferase [Melioribacteraceae bacterium]